MFGTVLQKVERLKKDISTFICQWIINIFWKHNKTFSNKITN